MFSNRRRSYVPIDSDHKGWGERHTVALLGFLGMASVYAMRVNLSVAIVAMVKQNASSKPGNSTLKGQCSYTEDDSNSDAHYKEGEFDWDENAQGLILGSFFYGYLLTNLIGGRAAEEWGSKKVFGFGVFFTALFTLLSPVAARTSIGMFVALRILEGITEGVTIPSLNLMLATWVPIPKRSLFYAFVYTGVHFGTVITLPVSGWLCSTDFLGGWPSVFYVFGALSLVWCLFWLHFIYDNPNEHPRISPEELGYLRRSCSRKSYKPISVPWKRIATSLPFWAIAVMHFGNNWGYYTLLTELPTYLVNIQHFNIRKYGVLSALPYFVMWIFGNVFGILMDLLTRREVLSILSVRRLAQITGAYGPMICLVLMCFVRCDKVAVIVILCIGVGLNGANTSGYLCSHSDIAPNLAGTLMGLTNTFATIPGFVAPAVTGALTKDNQTIEAWQSVFGISAFFFFISGTFYIIFIKADIQERDLMAGEEEDLMREE